MDSRLGLGSAYSLLYGVRKPEELLDKAVEYGCKTIAVADRNNLYGLHAVQQAAEERGLKPLCSVKFVTEKGSVFAIAGDKSAYMRLCEMLTLFFKDNRNSALRTVSSAILCSELVRDSSGLVLASSDPFFLDTLAGRCRRLYAALTPRSLAALPAAKKNSLPLLAIDDAVFLEPEDREIHRVLRAIALNTNIQALDKQDLCSDDAVFLRPDEFKKRLASWPEALQNTALLGEECQFTKPFDGWIFPEYPAALDPAVLLRKKVYSGAELRYGEVPDGVKDRIEYELEIITSKGFAAYFLYMADIVSIAERSCGRGSAAASLVSYVLGITHVDPIAHNLYFERFLNPAREDPPDIDVDFPWDERDALITELFDRFGEQHCARVANHNFFRFRSAVRECAKVYGFSDAEISSCENSLMENTDTGQELVWQEILGMAAAITGLPRGLSMHCGGLVISPDAIHRHAPVERSADGYPLLAWEKEGTEAAGLIKLDLLGNRSLALVRDVLHALSLEGRAPDFNRIRPEEDAETVAALAAGNSMGVFYIESPAMRQLQKKTGRGDFDHIVIHSSIIRPAANRFIAEYVRRLKGGAWEALHPRLDYILNETYGILCYQEDVSKTAIALASMSEAEADHLRKIIAKKAGGIKLEKYKDRFYTGCRGNKVPEHSIDAIWSMMLSFDGYSFCKPHSASYAMLSFQAAYLRVHYPAYFMAAVLSNQGGYYSAQAYISEARRMGLRVCGPDINDSVIKYSAAGNSLVIGFMAIKGSSEISMKQIVENRLQKGAYKSLYDVSSRIHINRDELASLCSAGVFDSLSPGMPRTVQLRVLLGSEIKKEASLFISDEDSAQGLVADRSTWKKDPERITKEFKVLGFLREQHPLFMYRNVLKKYKRIMAIELSRHEGRLVQLAGWPITRKEIWTKDGLAMNFISYEDETAIYETVLFPETYERYRNMLFDLRAFIVCGVVKNDQGAICVEIERIMTP